MTSIHAEKWSNCHNSWNKHVGEKTESWGKLGRRLAVSLALQQRRPLPFFCIPELMAYMSNNVINFSIINHFPKCLRNPGDPIWKNLQTCTASSKNPPVAAKWWPEGENATTKICDDTSCEQILSTFRRIYQEFHTSCHWCESLTCALVLTPNVSLLTCDESWCVSDGDWDLHKADIG